MTRKHILLTILAISVIAAVVVIIGANPSPVNYEDKRQPGEIVVTISSDLGYNINTDKVLEKIRRLKPDFHLTLGDFSYSEITPETEWCKYVRQTIGDEIPFQVVAGNHESDGLDGHIDNFIKCLPNMIDGVVGDYGKEYYFDYPQNNPSARFILISPELHFNNGTTTYGPKTKNLAWLEAAINGAREDSIPWVIVGMHKDCIRSAPITCAIGPYLMNYLIRKRVDLILQAHAHVYLRSKQLNCVIAVERGIGFDENCVVPNKLPSVYEKGKGPIVIVDGTGGQPIRAVDQNDAAIQYFETIMRLGENATHGVVKLTIAREQLRSEYVSATDVNFVDTCVIKQ